jgi:acyl carrier protein
LNREEIETKLRETMCEMFELDEAKVTPSADLREDLGLDSIDAVDMAVKLQQMTGKKVPLSELTGIRTMSDVVDVVEKHVGSLDKPAS